MSDLQSASMLVNSGSLTSVRGMLLSGLTITKEDVTDLSLPRMEETVVIENVRGEVGELLNHITCKEMSIKDMTIDHTNSSRLDDILRNNVEKLSLGDGVDLDISFLTRYQGDGSCTKVRCHGDSHDRFKRPVAEWGQKLGWRVNDDGESKISISRNKKG